jgi:hypothetical protein
MYKYGIQNMYNDNVYPQNILWKKFMNVCINVWNVYIHWCIIYKYGIKNMYNDSGYPQNILWKKSKPNANNNNNFN